MKNFDRRDFLRHAAALSSLPLLGSLPQLATSATAAESSETNERMRFGLVTYLWGKDMDFDTLLKACETSGLLGVELRAGHRHGVEPSLSKTERSEIKKRFEDSPVTLVGYGSAVQFHEDDPDKLKSNIELAKKCIQLSHDCGGAGVKVRPNGFVKGVSHKKTIEQIGKALNEVAAFGKDLGQEIRVEVHGRGTQQLPNIKAIFDVADHPGAAVCWNCNATDLKGKGLRHNFDLVKNRFGDTVHVRELNDKSYPYDELFNLFNAMNYKGWILLEARTEHKDYAAAMAEQRRHFDRLLAKSQA